jgi:type VI secretion system protein VasJ
MDFTTLGKTPIQGSEPCGKEAKYEPEFEAVLAEIGKLSSPSASSQVDWALVAEKAAIVIQDKSKDLTIACYLCMALVVTRKVEGLDLGLTVLRDVIETFWEDLFPVKRRMRGRVAAIQWWLERIETELQKLQPPPLPADQAERLRGNLKGIDAFLGQNMPDAPVLRALQRIVDAWPVQKAESLPEEKTAIAAAAAPPAPRITPQSSVKDSKPAAAETPAAAEAMTTAIADDNEARRAADAAFQRLRQVCAFLLQKDLKNPLSYRYRRLAAWAKLTALPVNTDGKTLITQPPPQMVQDLERLRNAGNPEALIQSAEPKLSQFVFWFDLNRFIAQALGDLGNEYQPAMEAVCQETSAFLGRLPGLENLRFADGTPFADAQTQQWLKGMTGPATVTPGKQPTGALPGGSDPFSVALQTARALVRKQNLLEAISMLQQEMQQTKSHCQRMRWRLTIARLLLEEKKNLLALPHLDQIVTDIDTYQLEAWDPELAVEGLCAAWRGVSAQSGNEHKIRANELLGRIAKVDPSAALRLAP